VLEVCYERIAVEPFRMNRPDPSPRQRDLLAYANPPDEGNEVARGKVPSVSVFQACRTIERPVCPRISGASRHASWRLSIFFALVLKFAGFAVHSPKASAILTSDTSEFHRFHRGTVLNRLTPFYTLEAF
jgi:hypothetical protein